MPKPKNKQYDEPDYADVVRELPERTDFQIGQCYDETAATTICCKICGTDKLLVGISSYYTSVKCPNCQWEICIHDG